MIAFILRRLLALIPLLLAVTLLVFVLMSLAPGDYLSALKMQRDIPPEFIEKIRHEFGLDQPWYTQYFLWLKNILSGNLGESWTYKVPVSELLGQRLLATFLLSLCATVFAWVIAVPLGVLAALKKDSFFDRLSSVLAYGALSFPDFFFALLALYFAASTGLFPLGGFTSIEHDFLSGPAKLGDIAYHLALPTLVLGLGGVAGIMRLMRANFLDVIRADYITTARAKGLRERTVMFKHALRNAINPLISSFGFALAHLLSGALIIEFVFNYPGLGQLIYQALLREDQFVVLAAVLLSCTMLVAGNLFADLMLAWSDPRIRLERSPQSNLSLKDWGKLGAGLAVLLALAAGLTALPWDAPAFRDTAFTVLRWAGLALAGLLGLGLLWALARFGVPLLVRLWPQFRRKKAGLCALVVLALLYLSALFAGFLAPYPKERQDLKNTLHPPTALLWKDGGLHVQVYKLVDRTIAKYEPIPGHTAPLVFLPRTLEDNQTKLRLVGVKDGAAPLYLLGSDSVGRDVLSRLLYGSRVSLTIGLAGIGITMVMGFVIGGLAGYFGGLTDFSAMRIVEFLMAIPGLYLLLALRSALAPYFNPANMYYAIIVILAFIGWAGAARVIRGMTLSLRQRPFVLASESMGQKPLPILFKHVLPNITSYLFVAATLSIPGYILGEANLSFLGLGIQEPDVSWGLMLTQAQDMKVFMLNFWWLLTPGFAIFLAVIAFNVLGDALRDIVDPRMRV